ncbi:MAG: T9SS type A sorting domain-containing protein [Brumimicrobium sp.]|nr:T9SS type A sorting domain-containing protein [Brumimicrobium sp.]
MLAGSARDSNLVQRGWLIKTNCNGEEGVQHPLTSTPCDEYDCTQYPIDANFTASNLTVDLVDGGDITFENSSSNTTSRVWDFGDNTKAYTNGQVTHTYTQEGIYDVELIVFHAMCSDTFSLQIEVTNTANITMHTALEKEVTLYPNPNEGNFTLANNTNQPLGFSILDATGKMVFQGEVSSSNQTDLSLNIPSGIYMVNLQQNGTRIIKKMVVR